MIQLNLLMICESWKSSNSSSEFHRAEARSFLRIDVRIPLIASLDEHAQALNKALHNRLSEI